MDGTFELPISREGDFPKSLFRLNASDGQIAWKRFLNRF
jgi:hypothetical protein